MRNSKNAINQISSRTPLKMVERKKTTMELPKPTSENLRKFDFDFFEDETNNQKKINSAPNSPKMKEDYSKIFTEKTYQTKNEEEKIIEVVQEGFLYKEGSHWKTWKKRFFILKSDGTLIYKEKFSVKKKKKKKNLKILNIG